MQKRNECSQLFPLPLAIRKEICVLIKVSLILVSSPDNPLPPLFFLQDSTRKKYSGSLALKEV